MYFTMRGKHMYARIEHVNSLLWHAEHFDEQSTESSKLHTAEPSSSWFPAVWSNGAEKQM